MVIKTLDILIVDDDEIDQRQLKRAISKSDLLANVKIVDKPSDAIEMLKEREFDCCFIDYLMPEMNGIDLVTEIRTFDDLIPLIIVTSQTDQELSKKAITAGATNYITKSLINPEGVSLLLRNSLHLQKIENDLKVAKSEALKLAQIKQDFLSNMSHEIRTPLNAINGFSDLLSQTPLSEEQKKYVGILNIASKNLSILINDILDVSKIESGILEFESNPIKLKTIIDDVIAIESSKAEQKGIRLISEVDNSVPIVLGDKTRIMQILLNLVSNAIKFTHEGHVKIVLKEIERKVNSSRIILTVEDSGIGIKEDKLESMFERFTQAEKSTTRLYGGTGLGLNIVKKLVGLMHGDIQVKSELNKGTKFTVGITFKLPENKHKKEVLETKEEENKNPLKNKHILVVEDNEHNQLLVKTYLQRNGAEVSQAFDGKEAIKKLENNDYDLILMDIQMPIMNGYETTVYIRKQLKNNLPIIACSAQTAAVEKETCFKFGMNDYISKPYTEKQLVATITNAKFQKVDAVTQISKELNEPDLTDNFAAAFEEMEKENGAEFKTAMLSISQKRISIDITELEKAIADCDNPGIRKIAHKLVGSFFSLNLTNGTKLAKATETSVIDKKKEDIEKHSKNLLNYLYNYKKYLNND